MDQPPPIMATTLLLCLLSACLSAAEAPVDAPGVAKDSPSSANRHQHVQPQDAATPADQNIAAWLPKLRGKRVGLVVNHTARLGSTHLADTLLSLGVDVQRVFAPEHGFRGTADAGAHIESGRDPATGLPIISLYGSHKKPSARDLAGLDLLVFDIQDVGARFYTYLSTLHYVLQAGAEHEVPVMVLDRPNPLGAFVDGPILDTARFRSFVGMHPIPVLHGMTLGELARMINGEGWLGLSPAGEPLRTDLEVIPCPGYRRTMPFAPPVAPSPNLRSQEAILLYPSLCFFEGTTVSIGRGTETPFRVIGHPEFAIGSFVFTPSPGPGAAHPKHEGVSCYGTALTGLSAEAIRELLAQSGGLNLDWLIGYHDFLAPRTDFFTGNGFFDKLAGTDQLRLQLEKDMDAAAIKATWREGLQNFKAQRAPYLLYP